ncbi:hypothetical protein CK203_115823 [Vitis vinifera]|uniref:Uncharacterized protein n=1 Tax=Vitis vinifera TaxID=29760 RepID=A0A438DFT7_VITVI|nr:hypothetical protein CK203_115823 [Vitis vinifera]
MARTRGAKYSSPSNRKRSLAKGAKSRFCSRTCSKAFAVETKSSSSEAGATKAAPRRYLTRSGEIPNPSPVQIQCRHRFPRQFLTRATPIPSPVPSPAPQEKAQEPQAPIPEPQIAAEAPLEEVIRRPMLPSPQSKETWIVELGHSILSFASISSIQSEARACPIIPAAEEISYGASASSKGFFLSRVVTDFYQTMTTKEPTQFDNFKAWANPTELEMVRTLQRSCKSITFAEGGASTLLYFEERFTRRSFKEQIAFHSSSQGCYAKFWSISDTPLSLSRKEREYAELAAIKACQEQMLASQAQQAAILRQLQVHFDLPQAVEPSTETPPEPHSQPSESHPPEPEAPADPPTEEADPSA